MFKRDKKGLFYETNETFSKKINKIYKIKI